MTNSPRVDSLSVDAEFQAYIRAFSSSSARVRWTMVVLTITCLLIFVGYRNSRSSSWGDSRIEVAQLALKHQVWNLKEAPENPKLNLVYHWAKNREFGKEEIEGWLDKLHSHRLKNVLLVRAPFLGLVFDVNDLGILGGVALSILMLVLAVCMAKQHENLYFGLWKVRQLAKNKHDGRDPRELANVLYHAMAMVEVFSKPPTLARWKTKNLKPLYRLLFTIPLLIQVTIFLYDLKTMSIAITLNFRETTQGIAIQLISIMFILILTFFCIAYARISDLRWRDTFLLVNPDYKKKDQPSWWKWMRLGPRAAVIWLFSALTAVLLVFIVRAIVHGFETTAASPT